MLSGWWWPWGHTAQNSLQESTRSVSARSRSGAGRAAGKATLAHVRASAQGLFPPGLPVGRADVLLAALPAAALPTQPPSFRFSPLSETRAAGGSFSRVHHVVSYPVSLWHIYLHRHPFPVGPERAQSPTWLRLRAQVGVSPCAGTGPEKHRRPQRDKSPLCSHLSPGPHRKQQRTPCFFP